MLLEVPHVRGGPVRLEPATAGRLRLLVVAGDADGNLGDRALLTGLCDDLRSSGWPVELATTARRISTVPGSLEIRTLGGSGTRKLTALRRAAAAADVVLWGGGGLLQDDDSLLKVPYWTALLSLLRPLSRCTVAYSLGVGPLRRDFSRLLARRALGCCDAVSTRDRRGQALASQLTSSPVTLVPDPALLLCPASRRAAREWLRERGVPLDGRPVFGIAPRRWFPPRDRLLPHQLRSRFAPSPEARAGESERLVDHVARALSRIAGELDAHLLFLPSYAIPVEGDVEICRRMLAVCRRLQARSGTVGQVEVIDDPRLYAAVTGTLDLMIGGRMHPTILAASAGTPIVGIGYNPKFDGFFDLLDAAELQIGVAQVVAEGGAEALERVIVSALERGAPRSDRVERLRERVRRFNRELLGSYA